MKILILSTIGFSTFIILDFIWFRFVGNFFKGEISSIARLTESGGWDVLILPAILVYVAMVVGLLLFVLPLSTSVSHALLLGALFGFVIYGVYDFTNLATLSAWSLRFVLVDVAWGTVLNGVTAALLYLVSIRF